MDAKPRQFKPSFGDRVENGWASIDNPTRIGIFVEVTTGGYRMTDGNGSFWTSGKENHRLQVLPNTEIPDRSGSGQ